jgi:hypothetical protein
LSGQFQSSVWRFGGDLPVFFGLSSKFDFLLPGS